MSQQIIMIDSSKIQNNIISRGKTHKNNRQPIKIHCLFNLNIDEKRANYENMAASFLIGNLISRCLNYALVIFLRECLRIESTNRF